MKTFTKEFKGKFTPIIEGFILKEFKIQSTDFKSLKREVDLIKKSTNNSKLSLFSLRYFLDKELFNAYLLEYGKD
jgi:hypothetical protein